MSERDDSLIDALAILSDARARRRSPSPRAMPSGGEVVVIHEGTCDDASTLPAFLLEDLDASGRSVTTIDAPLADLTSARAFDRHPP